MRREDELMPLFVIKKEVFEWIRRGNKTIELRRGKAKKGDVAVFQCGKSSVSQVQEERTSFISLNRLAISWPFSDSE